MICPKSIVLSWPNLFNDWYTELFVVTSIGYFGARTLAFWLVTWTGLIMCKSLINNILIVQL